MACGSEEYSCTSRTPQSSDAFSFFNLEADGATLKRPCRMHAGGKQAVTRHRGTSESGTHLTALDERSGALTGAIYRQRRVQVQAFEFQSAPFFSLQS